MNIASDQITPLILTFNEAPNIKRTLERLGWARQIIVVDSFSTDETLAILDACPQVTLLQRAFDSFAGQCNFGLLNVKTPWVLSLDADYVLSRELIEEIQRLELKDAEVSFSANFKYCVWGKPLRGTLYPARTVLYRREKASYYEDGHGHRIRVAGQIMPLNAPIFHDDRKSLTRWLQSQDRYMILEVQKLFETPNQELNHADRIRQTKVFAPFLTFIYCLFIKGVILDGWHGWYYTLQRTLAELLLSLRLLEMEKLQKRNNRRSQRNK